MENSTEVIIVGSIESYDEAKSYQRERMQKPRHIILIVLIIITVFHAALLIYDSSRILILLPGMVALIGLPLVAYLAFNGVFFTRRQYERTGADIYQIVFSDHDFLISKGNEENKQTYDRISMVQETKYAFTLSMETGKVYVASKQGFVSGDAIALKELLINKVGEIKFLST